LHLACGIGREGIWIDNDVLLNTMLISFGNLNSVRGRMVLMDCLMKLISVKVIFIFNFFFSTEFYILFNQQPPNKKCITTLTRQLLPALYKLMENTSVDVKESCTRLLIAIILSSTSVVSVINASLGSGGVNPKVKSRVEEIIKKAITSK
jgi:hypothetical protein